MELDFISEWPPYITRYNDHYSFNVRIREANPADSTVTFTILSKNGKDTESVFANKAPDSSYRAQVFLEGSSQNGVLKVSWTDTILCRYKNVSDTVLIAHSLGMKHPTSALNQKATPKRFTADGRRKNIPIIRSRWFLQP